MMRGNIDNHGITTRNFENLIVENCHFQSADPENGRIMTRGIASLRTWDRNHVIQNNTFEWIGGFPGSSTVDGNTGEVIMYHGGPDFKQRATTQNADWGHITVDIPYANFPTDRDFVEDIMVYVQTGGAKGQIVDVYDAIADGTGKTKLYVTRWQNRFPGLGDTVLVMDFARQNLILNNYIDSVPDPSLVTVNFNRTGFLGWSSNYDITVAGNTFKHLADGVRLNDAGDGLSAQVRSRVYDNTFIDFFPSVGRNKYTNFFSESANTTTTVNQIMHTVGSVFRGNVASGAEFGVMIGSSNFDRIKYPRSDSSFEEGHGFGIVGTIVENNSFNDILIAAHGLSPRSTWTLMRDNAFVHLADVGVYDSEKVWEPHYLSTWIDDSTPAGATTSGSFIWESAMPLPHSGTQHRRQGPNSGVHQHSFQSSDIVLAPVAGNELFCWVYLDPTNPPRQIMLQWNTDTWNHRAYWGDNLIGLGTDGTDSRRFIGSLPAVGQWTKLTVPASEVGLENQAVSGMEFTLYDGLAYFDDAGLFGTDGGSGWKGTEYEAENASIVSGTVKSDSDASNDEYVDGSGNFNLTFNHTASGTSADLEFRIKVPSGTRSMGVYVNNTKVGTLSTSSNLWATYTLVGIPMNIGAANSIEVRDSEGSSELDIDRLVVRDHRG